ncbi:head maturation protease, ClpP-related [Leucobacter salsicius]|uniref:head maturation protease, ClpP-related n=1 Tax=Leucobacter salsicius TaxID=664638 RepID=UPI00034721A6|nr:head maturation protease, ClpP-related [Leucobacter salsicius]
MNPFRVAGRAGAERTPIRAELPSVKTNGTTATLRLYDPIDSYGEWWGISAKEFTRVLDELPEETNEIRLLINSPGGEVWEGIAIMNALRAHPARIVAVVEGVAASAASFIATSADELVMMQNSELYIHNAWSFVVGDAADMRAVADELEQHYDRNIAAIYAQKSGDSVEHWLSEMDKDRFLTADEAVAEKLADRVEGVGDAAAAKAKFDLSVFARASGRRAGARAEISKTPSSTGPDQHNQKENVVKFDEFKAGIRERLGVTDADANEETVLAALDEALAEQLEPVAAPAAAIPAGTVLVDQAAYDELRSNAAAGRTALDSLDSTRRAGIISAALQDGRIAAKSADAWRAMLDKDEAGTSALLDQFPKNAVPVVEVGHADTLTSADDALYDAVYGSTTKEA